MISRRILVVGAPASGKRWLAGRIHALTGLPQEPMPRDRPDLARELAARREWIALTSEAEIAAELLDCADLVVLLATPLWLRDARLALRRIKALLKRRDHPRLWGLVVRTHRWDRDHLPRVRALLEPRGPLVASCASSEEVRSVLERVLGIPA